VSTFALNFQNLLELTIKPNPPPPAAEALLLSLNLTLPFNITFFDSSAAL
jgi:hypothetical protein